MQVALDRVIAWDANKGMNALDAFLLSAELSNAEFAAMVESSESSISRLRRGLQSPSFDLLTRIAAATGGKVTPNDFLPANYPQNAAAPDLTDTPRSASSEETDPAPDGPAPASLITNAAFALDWHKQKIADSETERANRAEQVLETVRAAVAVKGRGP